ncbi:hypothetical protein [Nocardia pseudobrasiliensis]|uniref:Uncharacterized protein n=1 Tax=Nocardia pseudobrasiliensis TaxID=45979 RepID=A0A370I968_9NOCA|nr:hypothetical protein [Nocardia pseudobrasiliensis]RDI67160.1 hypothetical protein DFR76_103231 [Nocardia pseudobrasiliensis]
MFPDPIPDPGGTLEHLDGRQDVLDHHPQDDVDRIISRWREQHHPERDR